MLHNAISRQRDLTAIIAIAVLSDLMAPLPFSIRILSALIAIPAVLFAPGYAVTRLVLPAERFGMLERVVISLGLSIAVTILCGVLVNFSPFGLNVVPFTWLVSLVTIVCAILVIRRETARFALPRLALRPQHWLWLGLAAALVIGAFAISIYGATTYQNTAFTQVWLLPADSTHVALGVQNNEGHTATYQVEIFVNGTLAHEWQTVTLTTQQSWRQSYAISGQPGTQVLVEVFRAESPATVYRTVTYSVPTMTAMPTRSAGA